MKMIAFSSLFIHIAIFTLFQTYANNSFVSSAPIRAKHVVGAGLGRTGTESFKYSIAQLGLGPGFHMQDNLEHLEYVDLWEKLEKLSPLEQYHNIENNDDEPIWESKTLMEPNEERIEIFTKILEIDIDSKNATYPSTMDFPTCIYFRDIIEAYKKIVNDPREVKVVLTSRTSGTKWASSFLATIGMTLPSLKPNGIFMLDHTFPTFRTIYRMMKSGFNRLFPSNIGQYPEEEQKRRLAQYHDTWNAHVRQVMKAYAKENNLALGDVFLDFQVQQGWKPLCEFLLGDDQSSCPSTPYPNRNDSKSMATTFFYVNIFGYTWSMIIFFIVYKILKKLSQKLAPSPTIKATKSKQL